MNRYSRGPGAPPLLIRHGFRPDKEAGDAAILPISPHMAMEAGQIQPVPFLVGIAEHEGIWRANNYLAQVNIRD